MIFKSTIVEIGSGKLGGTVYSRNRGGNYIKAFAMPTQVGSNAQLNQQAKTSALVDVWRGLTPSQQSAWKAAAPDYPYVNRVGDTKILSGYALFMSLNGTIQASTGNPFNVGQVISVPPGKVELPELVTTYDANFSDNAMTSLNVITAAAGSDEVAIVVYATRPLSSGITSPSKSAYRFVGSVADTTVPGTTDFASQYKSKFGEGFQIGNKFGLQIREVSLTTGQSTVIEQVLIKSEE